MKSLFKSLLMGTALVLALTGFLVGYCMLVIYLYRTFGQVIAIFLPALFWSLAVGLMIWGTSD